MRIPPRAARSASFVEKYALSVLFIYFAYQQFVLLLRSPYALAREMRALHAVNVANLYLPVLAKHALLCAFEAFVGLNLLLNRRPVRQPETVKEVFVPLFATFFFLAYNVVERLPVWWRQNLLAPDWRTPVSVAGLLVGVAGYAVALWSVVYLGRSFAVLVSVRTVVRNGPYRYVRHPIYCGMGCQFIGILMATLSPAMLLLTAIHLSLLCYRALLEEAALAGTSPEYHLYRKQTGFLFPKLFGASVWPRTGAAADRLPGG